VGSPVHRFSHENQFTRCSNRPSLLITFRVDAEPLSHRSTVPSPRSASSDGSPHSLHLSPSFSPPSEPTASSPTPSHAAPARSVSEWPLARKHRLPRSFSSAHQLPQNRTLSRQRHRPNRFPYRISRCQRHDHCRSLASRPPCNRGGPLIALRCE